MCSVGFMLQFAAGVDFNGSFYPTMYYVMLCLFYCKGEIFLFYIEVLDPNDYSAISFY